MDMDLRNPNVPTQPPPPGVENSPARKSLALGAIALAVAIIVAIFLFYRLHQVGQQITKLSKQADIARQQMQQAMANSEAALREATQAETHAQQAAQQRDQAVKAEAQSAQVAQTARQQAQAAQSQAAQAQQKAAQYRQQREAELERLQNALGQIAETRRTAMGLIVTLGSNSIRFDFDKANLRPENREVLSRIAGILLTLKGYHISVYGYTDDIGTAEYNLKLSERRAKTVRDYLVKAGLDPNIISTKGYGKSDPRVKGDTPQARAINRRVEIGIVDSSLQLQGPLSPSQ